MKGTVLLENVIEKVHDMSKNHYDETVKVKEMEFENADWLTIGRDRFSILPSAQRLFANRLRIPHSYLLRCPADLQKNNLQYWLDREAQNRDTFFCRFDENRLRAVFTERYTVLDHMEILSAMLENGFHPHRKVQFDLDENILVVKVPEYDRAFEVSDKDEMVPGISFGNSEVGILAFYVEVYLFRLVCSNGLIIKTSIGSSRFKHISRKALDCFHETLNQVTWDSDIRKNQVLLSAQTPVKDPIATITSFNKQFQLGKQEAKSVEMAWTMESGNSLNLKILLSLEGL